MMATTQEFRGAIRMRLQAAEAQDQPWLDIEAGVLHAELGGYPSRRGVGHQMPMCCDAMRQEMNAGDQVIAEPPSGKGASLKIRYLLPRSRTAPAGSEAKPEVGASVQHETARRALTIIAEEAAAGRQLTYRGLAVALGRSAKDARAVAQVCDLLDSAAALARRPLMALWTVRNAAGQINPQAWAKDTLPGLRDGLIEQARAHTFSDSDAAAIRNALDNLTGMGNRKAWIRVREVIPQEEMLARLQGRELQQTDSLNDLGTDEPPMIPSGGRSYARDPKVREAVIERAGGACEYCGRLGFKRPDGTRYLESHHIIALSNRGQDRMTNVIALCPGHHREAHFGEDSTEMERRMVDIVREKQAKPKG